jgi:hypothetical protein
MQRKQYNPIFEQWIAAYEIRLIQMCAAASKDPDQPEKTKEGTSLSREVTSE